MYVKSLTLKGFKSFADATTLELQPGVNVVVGPNGSGKSNVVDAVAWVLGAQGARSLRGGKMDDVIFAGTGKRAALGRAEVSLTIDNGSGRLPVDFSEVTITRTLFRSGESEYAINGVTCRLLDIQELLSDSGVGRQQHVIVSQGNLDAILTARPEDRRMVIEEAAGVLKYRRRRERSQRRLEGTEANLARLQDLAREVRQQLRPLQKQADAARRHEELAQELRNLRLYVVGQDLLNLERRGAQAANLAEELQHTHQQLRRELAQADAEVEQADGVMASLGHEHFGDQVERLEGLFQRAKGLQALIAERRRSVERQLVASVSADVVASLEADVTNARRELVEVGAQRALIDEPFAELSRTEAELGAEWIAFEEQWGEGLPVAGNEAAEIRGELSAVRTSVEGLELEVSRRRARLEEVRTRADRLAQEASDLKSRAEAAVANRSSLQKALQAAEAQRREAEQSYEAADAQLRQAEQQASTTRARAETLTGALDRSRAAAGVERLAALQGVTGTLVELVDVDQGFQAAFEAAAGEAMAAVVMATPGEAQAALRHLREGNHDGAVLVLDAALGPAGPAALIPAAQAYPAPIPQHLDPLLAHVRGISSGVNALLHRLLGATVVVDGWQTAADLVLQQPGLTAVTKDGDRFSPAAWRIGAGGDGATSSAVRQAEAQAATAATALAEQRAQVQAARTAKDEAVRNDRQARGALDDNDRAAALAESSAQRAEAGAQGAVLEIGGIEGHLTELTLRFDHDNARLSQLQAQLPALEAAEADTAERVGRWREARAVLEERSGAMRVTRSDLEVRAASLDERATSLRRRVEGLEQRLARHRVEAEQAGQRRRHLERTLTVADALGEVVARHGSGLGQWLETARHRRDTAREQRRQASERLDGARRRKSQIERRLLETGESRQQHEVRQTEIRLRHEALMEGPLRELEVTAQQATQAPLPELPPGITPKQRVTELEGELRRLGPINPLALEEYNAVDERHRFLDEQLQDVQGSRRELMRIIRAVDAEIVQTFEKAFKDVAANFESLFAMLFPGGTGKLSLTDPQNLLETGIEIEAKPSGKNVRTLSLLSGGERSLSALAFLFAVFRSRPSPFYLLDEVEAALDDMNLHRFLGLIDEFRREAQLVIVSHQRRTMESADTLYGVSMQPGGSSKVVCERISVDLRDTPSTGEAHEHEPVEHEHEHERTG